MKHKKVNGAPSKDDAPGKSLHDPKILKNVSNDTGNLNSKSDRIPIQFGINNQLKEVSEPLKKPETFTKHFKELMGLTKAEKEQKTNSFPYDVFPISIQQIVTETNSTLNYPIDFIGASILYAISVAIGNTRHIEFKRGYTQNAVLYMAIVGRKGTNKSHPLSFALRPLEKRDDANFQIYKREKAIYEARLRDSRKGHEQNDDDDDLTPPFWKQLLVSDFTPEALAQIHKSNLRGLGVYVDELASWFKNFNRYKSGSEEQFWLTIWSGKPIRINRKTSDPIYIDSPFVSVIGTIQPAVLKELAKDRTENGFLDRMLFAFPENLKKEYWNQEDLSPMVIDQWDSIITKLLDLTDIRDGHNKQQSKILKLTPEAKRIFFQWQKESTDICNNSDDDTLSGIYAKLEQYVLRISLCLHMVHKICGEEVDSKIGTRSIQGAIKLAHYFQRTAIEVHASIATNTPVDKLPDDKKILYDQLPTQFRTADAVEKAKTLEIPERTVKHFISNKKLFHRLKQGLYEKV